MAEEYPDFIEFLNVYYDYMAQKGTYTELLGSELLAIRDLDTTSLSLLDKIFFEIGNGSNSRFFDDPRLVGKVISFFLQKKGTEYSVLGFFRMFFGETPTVVYPKNNIFIVDESKIGSESLKYIIDDERYQIFSILIQSGIPISTWETLYRTFAHPSGFYLAGDVLTEDIACFFDSAPLSYGGPGEGVLSEGLASFVGLSADEETTILYDSDGITLRMNVFQPMGTYDSMTLGELDVLYDDTYEIDKATSHTMDIDSDGIIKPIEASNILETADRDRYMDSGV